MPRRDRGILENLFDLPFKQRQPDGTKRHYWQEVDNQASEREVMEFLYGLVRLLKPRWIYETGTYLGYTTLYLAHALQQNDRQAHLTNPERWGRVVTVELDEDWVNQQVTHPAIHGNYITQLVGDSATIDLAGLGPFDLCYFDCDHQRSQAFLNALTQDKISPDAVIVFHDTSGSCHWSEIGEDIFTLEQSGYLKVLRLKTPRGIALAQLTPDYRIARYESGL